jgi:hypothetical protein
LGGTADRSRVRLKYAMQTAQTSIVTTGAFSYVFRGNSVFDPDFTSTGGQPANFDDWAALYGNYRVFGSSIEVHVLTSTSGTECTSWVVAPRHSSTSLSSSSFYDAVAMPYARCNMYNIYRTGAPDSHFKMNMTSARFLGLSPTEFLGRDDCTAAVGANPALPWYWHVAAINVDTSVTSEVAIQVTIVYDVEFFNRLETSLDLRLENLFKMKSAFISEQKGKTHSKKGHYVGEKLAERTDKILAVCNAHLPQLGYYEVHEHDLVAERKEEKSSVPAPPLGLGPSPGRTFRTAPLVRS